ncbi:cupin domain-containing protein [Halomonas beimenensis]|uniref:Cupin 2, conserved barrel domain protein n=1 Tax=Halomonas beimenensis TaxID=475662 RepID=A0A291P6E0_9GAMM|nr:cupin domain-containing protein [Halomonas beimenensis]ATJ82454.1 cupin 2, conserved barrel domain protein [Halomonas beimenensis]
MYLSADDIAALEGVTKQHFLNDRAIRVNKSLGDAVGLQRLGVHLIRVAPGCYSTEYHAHHYEEECLYVLSGRGLATLGERRVAVGPGDFIGCPTNGVAHDLYNDGDGPLTCLVIGQRLDQDVSDYPRRGKRLYRNSGEWNLVDQADIERIER